jgi:signal transduction histidine kinase
MTAYASLEQQGRTRGGRQRGAGHNASGQAVRQLAHDLRQPIAAIQALAAAAAADPRCSGSVLVRLRQIADEAGWMARAIDELLADPETNAEPVPEPVPIGALVRDVVNSERLTYRGQLTADCQAGTPRYVLAPATALRRALANVLANATRAAGAGGHVRVTDRAADGVELIEITDDGPGFGHVPAAHGIGLQVTRRTLTECGGRLDIERRPPGQTLVRLTLPLASAATGAGGQ